MTPEQIKAQEIVEKYREVLGLKYIHSRNAYIACAITEVEGKIADLKAIHDTIPGFKWFIRHRIEEQEAILQELKNMNQ